MLGWATTHYFLTFFVAMALIGALRVVVLAIVAAFRPMRVVDWGASCGRTYLTVCGVVAAMEGDPNRDAGGAWTGEQIKRLAAKANGGVLP